MTTYASPRLDVKKVLGGLLGNVGRVLDRYGVEYQDRAAELRTRLCPECGQRSRPSVSISTETGLWIDFAHGCHGDILALVAGYGGLDIRSEFPRVLELGAEIAGLSPVEADLERHRPTAERHRAPNGDRNPEEAKRAALRASMPERWAALAHRDDVGERFLVERGLDPEGLCARGDVVRYSSSGDPAMALRDLANGQIVGIQYRCLDGGRKLTCEFGSKVKGAALWGRRADLDPDGVDVAVLVEGFADTLAAHLQWPGCAIFGAPGADQLPRIASAVARRVVEVRGWLLIAVDDDEAGVNQAAKAIVAAVDAGLALAPSTAGIDGPYTVRLIELGPHHDLADAHRVGWRYGWPALRAP